MTSFLLPADELEYAVLAKLWELGAASVRELHEHLGEPAGRVYTTTAKVIDRLRGKGLIQRQRRGKAFVYKPRVARPEVESARAKQAVSRLLGATPRAAVASCAGFHPTTSARPCTLRRSGLLRYRMCCSLKSRTGAGLLVSGW